MREAVASRDGVQRAALILRKLHNFGRRSAQEDYTRTRVLKAPRVAASRAAPRRRRSRRPIYRLRPGDDLHLGGHAVQAS